MAVSKTDWSQPASAPANQSGGDANILAQIQANLADAAAQNMAEQIAESYGNDYGAGFFDYGPSSPPVPDLGFGASLGAVTNPQVYPTLTPGQQADLNRYIEAGPGQDYSFGMLPKVLGLLGAPTRYDQITSGQYKPVFVGDKFYGTFGAGPFGGNVYTGRPLPTNVAAEYGIPGFEDTSSDPEVVAPVADVTGQPRCPEGYIFDEDLQACRLDTSAPIAKALESRAPTRSYSLLDQSPDGLLEFQRRYGLPQQEMGFSLLT
jgi:hypothetical protein